MKMTKKTSVSGVFAKKADYEFEGQKYKADIQTGDKVTFNNAGDTVEGAYGEQKVFSILTRNGDKNINLNQKSINALIDEYGDDSEKWVGKEVNVLLKKDVVAGKKVIIAYFVPDGWELDDFGDLVNTKVNTNQDNVEEDIDVIEG